jgi:hypothetical protein
VLLLVTFIMLCFYLPAAAKIKAHRNATGAEAAGCCVMLACCCPRLLPL